MANTATCLTEISGEGLVSKLPRPPPPCARGQSDIPTALTDEQRQFAGKHHNLIYSFLHKGSWEIGEYYDIAALGFLSAVKRYLTEQNLRQYAFSTVAFQAMKRSLDSFHRAEARRRESEQRYLELRPRWEADLFEELEANLLLHDLAAISSEEQYALASMRLQGYSIAEVAFSQGMNVARVQSLLREMYRIYLKLYINQ